MCRLSFWGSGLVGQVVGGCVTQTGEQTFNVVRTAWLRAGLPIGAMITGRQGEDVALLQLCRALEEARPWRARRAPLARELAAGDAAHSGGSKLSQATSMTLTASTKNGV